MVIFSTLLFCHQFLRYFNGNKQFFFVAVVAQFLISLEVVFLFRLFRVKVHSPCLSTQIFTIWSFFERVTVFRHGCLNY